MMSDPRHAISALNPAPNHGPPRYEPGLALHLVTRHADVTALLRHPDVAVEEASEIEAMLGGAVDLAKLDHLVAGLPLTLNSPRHDVTRRWMVNALKVLSPAFTAEAVAAETRALCAAHPEGTPFDALASLCDALPTRLMAKATGLPLAAVSRIAATGWRLFEAVFAGKSGRPGMTPRVVAQFDAAADRLVAETIAALEQAGGSPILSLDELRAREGCSGPAFDPLMAFIYVIASGMETTTGALCNALSACMTDDAARKAFASPAPGRDATAELIRLSTSVSFAMIRVARADVTANGWTIPAGDRIALILEQADCDPAVYPAPDSFCPVAGRPASVTFGAGAHRCVGAAVATTMITSFLRVVLGEENLRLVDADLTREPLSVMRRPRSLIVARGRRAEERRDDRDDAIPAGETSARFEMTKSWTEGAE